MTTSHLITPEPGTEAAVADRLLAAAARLAAAGDPDAALEKLVEAAERDPARPEPHERTAALLFADRRYLEALRVSDAARERFPHNPRLHLLAGAVRLALGWGREAITPLRRASLLAPDSPEILFQLARAYSAAGEDELAAESLERLALVAPHKEVLLQLAACYERLGLGELGARAAAEAEALKGPGARGARLIAEAERAADRGRYEEALEMAERAARDGGASVQLELLRWRSLEGLGRDHDAYEAARRAAELDPGSAAVAYAEAVAALRLNRRELAIRAFERLAGANPGSELPLESLGTVLMSSGDWRPALQAFEAALSIDPGSEIARRGIVRCLEESGEHERAEVARARLARSA